ENAVSGTKCYLAGSEAVPTGPCNAIVGQAFQPDAPCPTAIKAGKQGQPRKADLLICGKAVPRRSNEGPVGCRSLSEPCATDFPKCIRRDPFDQNGRTK